MKKLCRIHRTETTGQVVANPGWIARIVRAQPVAAGGDIVENGACPGLPAVLGVCKLVKDRVDITLALAPLALDYDRHYPGESRG